MATSGLRVCVCVCVTLMKTASAGLGSVLTSEGCSPALCSTDSPSRSLMTSLVHSDTHTHAHTHTHTHTHTHPHTHAQMHLKAPGWISRRLAEETETALLLPCLPPLSPSSSVLASP